MRIRKSKWFEEFEEKNGAGHGVRTRDIQLGKPKAHRSKSCNQSTCEGPDSRLPQHLPHDPEFDPEKHRRELADAMLELTPEDRLKVLGMVLLPEDY